MDIPRSGNRRKKLQQKLRWPAVSLLGIACVVGAISLSNPSLPEADKRAMVLGTVSQGEMLRRVRGPGNLVPRDVRWLTARTTGRVDRIYIEPGQQVGPDTLLLTLDNPEVVQQAREARLDLRASEAEHKALLARLEDERLAQRSIVAEIEAELEHASFRYQAEKALESTNAVSELDLNESRILVQQLTLRREMEQTRMEAMPRLHAAQVSVSEVQLETLRERLVLRQELEEALSIRAGIEGVVQDMPVEQGQQLQVGAVLARVANPNDLKAELRISEVMARELAMLQPVSVDTRNGIVAGHVSRIDPAVENGTVTVDVTFSEPLPPSARLDQSVDAVIEIERLENVVFIERPTGAQAASSGNLFVMAHDGQVASRRSVRFGRGSVNYIEIVDGLQVGEQVILSDTANFTQYAQIALR